MAVSVSFPVVGSALTLAVGIALSVISFQHMLVNLVLSVAAFAVAYVLIPKVRALFLKADLGGIDLNKREAVKM